MDINPARTFARIDSVVLKSGEDIISSAVVDPAHGYAYIGTYTTPGIIARLDIGAGPSLPAVTTTAISGITSTGASSGGTVTSDGGATVTARGVCWSTSLNPTTADSHSSDGTGTGAFDSSLSGLKPNTPYHVRAYATNSAGTAYGNDIAFTTSAQIRKADVLGSWAGQGIYSRNPDSGQWAFITSAANRLAAGDLDGDGKADLIGLWPVDGIWVKYSFTGNWQLLGSAPDSIAAGRLR